MRTGGGIGRRLDRTGGGHRVDGERIDRLSDHPVHVDSLRHGSVKGDVIRCGIRCAVRTSDLAGASATHADSTQRRSEKRWAR